MREDRSVHRKSADRIHRDWDKLRHAGSTPRHSPDQPKLLLPEAPDCAKTYQAAAWKDRRGEERAVKNGVVKSADELFI